MFRTASLTAVLVAAIAAPAIAQDANPAVSARQAHMDLLAFNLGTLGNMARERIEYDAEAASAAAANLVALTSIDQSAYWVEGTDADTLMESHALPAIWENMDDFEAKTAALHDAAMAMEEAAGVDLASLQGAMGGLGQGCGGCHQLYRQSDN
ncbi:cytochrome c [Marivivens aquimaris]|uniref:cytochrome c n=1 Tax=Marivivens aquimaris TaxID=2774876 RepID=UPI00188068F7|nr:cytochrome c [Marivivens aquimaris]